MLSSPWTLTDIRKKSLRQHSSEVRLGRELQLVQGPPIRAFERKVPLFKSRSHPRECCSSRRSGPAQKLSYVHMGIAVLLRIIDSLVLHLSCGGCEEAHKFEKTYMFTSSSNEKEHF